MTYMLFLVEGIDSRLVASKSDLWEVCDIAYLLQKFPNCDELIIKRIDEKECKNEVSSVCYS